MPVLPMNTTLHFVWPPMLYALAGIVNQYPPPLHAKIALDA